MKLRIENLGPIKSADLKIGDMTVIVGPPNTGKSYTLKALYASTLMLDEAAREFEFERLIEEVAGIPALPSTISAVQVLSTLAIFHKFKLDLTPDDIKTLHEIFKEITKAETVNWSVKDNIISVTLRSSKSINLSEILEARISNLWNILPSKQNTRIRVEGIISPPKISELIFKSLTQPYTFEKSFSDDKQGIVLEMYTMIRPKHKALEVIGDITLSCDMKSPALEKSLKEAKISKLEKLLPSKDFRTIIKEILTDHDLHGTMHELFFTYLTTRGFIDTIMEPLQAIKEYMRETVGKLLELAYRNSFDIQTVRFIPFGRTPIICQLEYISKEPFLRTKYFMQSFYGSDILLYSYMSWLSRGRAKIAERKYNEGIIKLFKPVLQGELTYDKTLGLMYKCKRYRYNVPIKWASALAGEVAGILLPILATPPKSMIIIEEPESQLHLSAQILMALTLAGLSSEYNHKLVFSTHSDLFALVLAYIKEYKPSEEEIKRLIKKILRVQKIRATKTLLESLVKSALKAKDLEINFYYYEPNKEGVKVLRKVAGEIIKKVPSLTDVIDEFASWALSLGGEKVG